jgi:hypothetical protein
MPWPAPAVIEARRARQGSTLLAPTPQCLAWTVWPSPGGEEFGKRLCGGPVSGDRGEQGENGKALAEVDVFGVVDEANVPANGGPLVPLRVLVGEEQSELEGIRQRDELELRRAEE